MHELSLAMSVMDVVSRQLASRPDATVSAIEMEIGEHSGVDLPSFRIALSSVLHSSPWPGAEVEISVIPAAYQCIDCEFTFMSHSCEGRSDTVIPEADLYPSCPQCGRRRCLPVAGREFRVKALRLSV